ncbi:hypothetical protein Q5H89_04265 [Hymenobacter sp. CA2-7]|nr:hypothetical protein [Hymenobacter sp. CA2-7]
MPLTYSQGSTMRLSCSTSGGLCELMGRTGRLFSATDSLAAGG